MIDNLLIQLLFFYFYFFFTTTTHSRLSLGFENRGPKAVLSKINRSSTPSSSILTALTASVVSLSKRLSTLLSTGFYPGKRATWKISTRLLNVLPSINKVGYYYLSGWCNHSSKTTWTSGYDFSFFFLISTLEQQQKSDQWWYPV